MEKPFPTLTTSRLILRQLRVDDATAIFTLRSDAEVNAYLDRVPAQHAKDAEDFIKRILQGTNENLYWVIAGKEDHQLIGTICLFNFSLKKAEIGFELLPPFQGKGLMREAASRIIRFAKETLALKSIAAEVHGANQKSVQLLTKLGFKQMANEPSSNPFQLYSLRL